MEDQHGKKMKPRIETFMSCIAASLASRRSRVMLDSEVCGNDNARIKIISGGQTGVDRAALDAAIEMGVDYGGWCPKGGWAEDFRKPPGLLARYPLLRETPSAEPTHHEWNVRDADRLMVLIDVSGIGVSKGTVAARDFALALGKPHSMIDLDAGDALATSPVPAKTPAHRASALPDRAKAKCRAFTPRRGHFYVRFLPG